MNLQKMLKQAQDLQGRMAELQARLEAEETEGSAGGGMVKIRLNGKSRALKADIDAKLFDPAEKEMLEDLIVAAINDARTKIEARLQQEMGQLVPPGFKAPF